MHGQDNEDFRVAEYLQPVLTLVHEQNADCVTFCYGWWLSVSIIPWHDFGFVAFGLVFTLNNISTK